MYPNNSAIGKMRILYYNWVYEHEPNRLSQTVEDLLRYGSC